MNLSIQEELSMILSSIAQNKELPQNVLRLAEIGKVNGFGDDTSQRLQAYRILLDISEEEFDQPFVPQKIEHSDSFQEMISRNCGSCFRVIDVCIEESNQQRIQQSRIELISMTRELFDSNKELSYYRGFEGFAGILLWNFGLDKAAVLTRKLAQTLYRQAFFSTDFEERRISSYFLFPTSPTHTDALIVEIDKSVSKQVDLIKDLASTEDPQVAGIFSVTHFLAFCVGWVLTWWTLNIRKNSDLLRVYDYLISAGPTGVVHLGAAFILGTKEILKEHIRECFDGGEIGVLFGIYQNLWQVEYDINHVMRIALDLSKRDIFTPEILSTFALESMMRQEVLIVSNPIRVHLRKKQIHRLTSKIILPKNMAIMPILVIFFLFMLQTAFTHFGG